MHLHFEWDMKKAASNLRKHKVSLAEAAEVFRDPLALTILDDEHSQNEERWITLGQAQGHRLIVVAHTWREEDSGTYTYGSSQPAPPRVMKLNNTKGERNA